MSKPSKRSFEVVSPSLLESVKIHPVRPEFNLGMDDYPYFGSSFCKNASADAGPSKPAKRPKPLSLKKRSKENDPVPVNESTRFEEAFSVASEDQYDQLAKEFVPKNTGKCTTWAINNFYDWCKERNARFPDREQCPEDLLTKLPYDSRQLCHWLCQFVAETRQKNGTKYLTTTLYQLLCGVDRFMRSVDARAPNVIDQKNPDFKELHCTMDSIFRSLRVEGVGVQVKHASVITREEENLLWEQGVLNLNTRLGLLCAVFYSNGKMFCLWGG